MKPWRTFEEDETSTGDGHGLPDFLRLIRDFGNGRLRRPFVGHDRLFINCIYDDNN